MTNDQLRIVEKAKKMIALAEGTSSEEEAKTAMVMVQQLLSKYNLSITDLNVFKDKSICNDIMVVIRTKMMPLWVKELTGLCRMACDCEILLTKTADKAGAIFIGIEPATTICSSMFITLYKLLDSMALVDYPTLYTGSRKESWRRGFIFGLAAKIKEQKEQTKQQEYGLMVIQKDKIEQHINSHYRVHASKAKDKDIKDSKAFSQGYKAGMNYNLNPQIEG